MSIQRHRVDGQRLHIVPVDFRVANDFVYRLHRHLKPVVGYKFAIGASDGRSVRGVAIVGRPVARLFDDGLSLEVNRCCTDGTFNACSVLYAAAWRVARELGFRRLITYTLPDESGASLRAAGFVPVRETRGGSWDRRPRPRQTEFPICPKILWEIVRPSPKIPSENHPVL